MKKYKIIYQDNLKTKKNVISTNDISKEVLPKNIISIKELRSFDIKSFFNKKKINDKQMKAIFHELNMMIESGLTFNDSIDILIKNNSDKVIIEFLNKIKDNLIRNSSLELDLKEYKINYLIVIFLEQALTQGNLELNIKALNILLKETYEIKKMFIKSIIYPLVLVFSFIISLISIFYFVVPKFELIFQGFESKLPFATKVLFFTQNIFINYSIYILLFVFIALIIIIYLYKRNKSFRKSIDKIIVEKIFFIKDIYLNMQIYRVFLIIDIMQKSNYEFHKALISSKILLKNQYLLDKITKIDNLLQNGKSISHSFSKANIFDDITLNLLNTAEMSNSMISVVEELKKIYKNKFYDKIKLLITVIEPIFLITIMSLIVWLVFAIFIPIWDMGNFIKI